VSEPGGRREPLLFGEFPALRGAVPWMPLIHAPTPVEPCSRIAGYLGREGVFVKRDDRVAPLYGGNKIRRFEYLLADARRRGARTLVTAGGLASTQVLATLLFGSALGFEVHAALFDQRVTHFARRTLRQGAGTGGTLLHGGSYAGTALAALRAHIEAERAYLILPGASSPLANLGYVDAMLELAEQVRRGEAPRPDVIVVPAGSGGTLAGLCVGAALLGWPTRVVGVRITERIACNRATIRFLVEATGRRLARWARSGPAKRIAGARFSLFHGAIGAGYGEPTAEAIDAIPEVERLTGTPGEITYSGKGLAGLRALGRTYGADTLLYWHTLSSAAPPPMADPSALGPGFQRFFAGDVTI
jgi:1-aminocyclopropane-1-carboxylate deaminase/D-cysteine desulfhydrase-like pyridoxal-dependent ACC family enzyme